MKNKNVILITVDALRANHLGYMGYPKQISPNIDLLAKKSAVFTNAYATGPVTPHSFPGILTSTYPFDYQGPRNIEKPRTLISEVFKENGFTTAAFHSNSYLSNFFGYNQGWNFFEDMTIPSEEPEKPEEYRKRGLIFSRFLKELFKKVVPRLSPELFFWIIYLKYKLGNPGRNLKVRAELINQTVKDFIDSTKDDNKPFFIWIHYMDIHTPYISQENRIHHRPLSFLELTCSNFEYIASYSYFKKRKLPKSLLRFGEKYLKETINLYDQEIEYLDGEIGDLIKFLKREKLYDESVICLTADHGDEFLEHKGGSHSQKLYNELLHIPLLIKGASQDKTERIDKKVSLIDLSPTLCDLAKLNKPSAFKGKNLFADSKPLIFHQTSSEKKGVKYYVFGFDRLEQCKIGCQSEEWKYIIDYGNNIEELYNLSSDPQEQNNVVQLEPKVATQMKRTIQEFNKNNPPFSLSGNNNK